MMQVLKKPTSGHKNQKNPEVESEQQEEDIINLRFDKSLQELKDLRSQLHYAADYCENTFSDAQDKKIAVENTKEYICRAVVAVVDHLGCVSTNLNCSISRTREFSDAELRINCLKLRLLSCEQYCYKLATRRVSWCTNLPKFHPRYLSTPNLGVEKSNENERDTNFSPASAVIDKHGFNPDELPLFLYTYSQKKLSSLKTSSDEVLPVRDAMSILLKAPNPTFHFQQGSPRQGRYNKLRKSVQSNDILSIIRRAKRTQTTTTTTKSLMY